MNDKNPVVRTLKKSTTLKKCYRRMKQHFGRTLEVNPEIYEITELLPRPAQPFEGTRLNVLVPTIHKNHIFGGIATALKFYEQLAEEMGAKRRILVMNSPVEKEDVLAFEEYVQGKMAEDVVSECQIVCCHDRLEETLPVGENDIFVATAWWTAYNAQPIIQWQKKTYGAAHSLVYLIQDYEPFFYPWSTRYALSESTYRMDIPVTAAFNSSLLQEYFNINGYHFENEFYFNPVLNDKLKKYLDQNMENQTIRKKQILIYGRPSVARNGFELIVGALKIWSKIYKNAKEWEILSAGEQFDNIQIEDELFLKSLGKLTLEEYAKIMSETFAGISLMISPHPSYPPLEMSTFGIKTITNCYGNKDLSTFNENLISISNYTSDAIAHKLCELCDSYTEHSSYGFNKDYIESQDGLKQVVKQIRGVLINERKI